MTYCAWCEKRIFREKNPPLPIKDSRTGLSYHYPCWAKYDAARQQHTRPLAPALVSDLYPE